MGAPTNAIPTEYDDFGRKNVKNAQNRPIYFSNVFIAIFRLFWEQLSHRKRFLTKMLILEENAKISRKEIIKKANNPNIAFF